MSEMVDRVAIHILAKSARPGMWTPTEARECAIAAIEAMREPTEAMECAMYDGTDRAQSLRCWQAMIDEALK